MDIPLIEYVASKRLTHVHGHMTDRVEIMEAVAAARRADCYELCLLYIAEGIKAGGRLVSVNLRSVRPGHGLPQRFYENLIGRKVIVDLSKKTQIEWRWLEPLMRSLIFLLQALTASLSKAATVERRWHAAILLLEDLQRFGLNTQTWRVAIRNFESGKLA